MQQKPKDASFYERFHQQLLDSNTWPGTYIFKFIIASSASDEEILLALFQNDDVRVNVRASSKGKYTSISITGTFESPDVIIQKHKQAAKIPNIIQL